MMWLYIAGATEENWLGKPIYVSNCSTFFSNSIGWEIVEFMLTRTKAEFGLRILKDALVKDLLRERKFIIYKMQQDINPF